MTCIAKFKLSSQNGGVLVDRTNNHKSSDQQQNLPKQPVSPLLNKKKASMNIDDTFHKNLKPKAMQSLVLPSREANPNGTGSQLCWVGMNPVEWVDSLKAKATTSGKFSPESLFDGTTFHGDKRRRDTPQGCTEYRHLQPAEYFHDVPTSSEVAAVLDNVRVHQMPLFWNFNFFEWHPVIDRIRLIALAIEGHSMFFEVKLPFERIRDHFTFTVNQFSGWDLDPSTQAYKLCIETIHKLVALLQLAVDLEKKALQCLVLSPAPTPVQESHFTSPMVIHPSAPLSQEDFGAYMINWLRANWISPYPDQAILQNLIHVTGMDARIINTWLAKARRSEWRVAIQTAFNLNRPSGMLLEDSLNLFDKKPLGIIREYDTSGPKRPRLG